MASFIDRLLQKKLLIKTNLNYYFWFKKQSNTKKIFPKFKHQPLISIIVPVWNPPENYFKQCLDSVLKQTYQNWELCIVDDHSSNPNIRQIILNYAIQDKRIKYKFRDTNGHISQTSNDAINLSTGEFITLLDHDDEIAPHALASIVNVLNKYPKSDFIYSDEDKIGKFGIHCDPSFKSDFALDRLLSNNYICHLSTFRKSLVNKIGGFRVGFEGSQDYDLILRIIEKTKNIIHIPDILYHWRKIPNSTASIYSVKSYANTASLNALSDYISRNHIEASTENGLKLGTFRVKYTVKDTPLVSIIIASNDELLLSNCINSIINKSTYINYEIIAINNGSKMNNKFSHTTIFNQKTKFNYSQANNFGVSKSTGDYLLFLNNDTKIITPDWIQNLLGHAQQTDVGAVGCKLLYPNGLIQHSGVYLGVGGIANHNFYRLPDSINQPFPMLNAKDIINNYSAVTGACLMVNKNKFIKVSGFDTTLAIAYNDIDLCLKLSKLGYKTVYTPYSIVTHLESISISKNRNQKQFQTEQKIIAKRWSKLIKNDPFYNPNLPH